MRPLRRIVVHHSASPRLNTTAALIRRWHVDDNHWADIGYHYVIEALGKLVPGRPLDERGAHCPHDRANEDSVGICVVGNNSSGKPVDHWDADQKQVLLELIHSLKFAFPSIEVVVGHRDVPGTATLCPGIDIADFLAGRA